MKIYQIIACFIPSKKGRQKFRNFVRFHINPRKIAMSYQQKIAILKHQEKIKVAFLVWENCKWSYDGLYHKFQSDKRFEPIICLINDSNPVCHLDQNKAFFKTKGMDYRIVNTPEALQRLKPDIVFYEQPWVTFENRFAPKYVSEYAVCLYVPYSIELDPTEVILSKTRNFYLSMYQNFVFSSSVQKSMKAFGIENTICSGHPRLDAYLKKEPPKFSWKSQNKVRIVYAPHHSFRHSILKWATYEWSGAHLIQLAKDHQDTTEWIFKPHPRFYITLVEEFGQEFADSVFEQWTQVSRLYDQGDYFDLFKTADLMISDCGSFQIEWLPTHKPYIHLVSNYPDAEPDGQLKKHFSSGYYLAHSIKELDDYFQQLVVLKQDPKREKREELIREIPLNASEVVFSYVKQLIAPTP